ncbi:MAG: SUMF1/EgtB/PvdO family nonheme iron enzyme [Candidatus Thiodiazotropha endolucinida]
MLDPITRNLFISYAREDRPIAETLHAYLKPLIAQGKLQVFIDTEEIEKGEEWHKKITDQLHHADAFLFLISQHFFRSNYVIETELPAMIKRYREEQVECWPFLVSDYPWDDFVIDGFKLAGFQAIGPFDSNKGLTPLNALPAHDQESQFRSVYTEVRNWIEKLELEVQQKQEALSRQQEQKEREEKRRMELEEQRKHRERQQSERKRREQEKQTSATQSGSRQDDTHISQSSPAKSGSDKATSAFSFKYLWLVIFALVAVVLIYQLADNREQKQVAVKLSQPELGSFRDTLSSGGKGPEMVEIPAGSFMMGSTESEPGWYSDEAPQHKVQIHPFALGKTEVTFDDYDRFVDATGRQRPDDQGWGRGLRPVINVSWHDAVAYTEWLSRETGNHYRLPSEAEWEYAARAGTITAYPWGDQASHDHANYGKDECCEGLAEGADKWINTAPVGQFTPNNWQLYDMSGNVWEWVQDCYVGSYEGAPRDGTPREDRGTCGSRVLRGGSWLYGPLGVRSANRFGNSQSSSNRSYNTGFRLARAN